MNFEEHGQYKTTFDGQIILVEGVGPWNIESVLSFIEQMKTIQVDVGHACIGCITVLRGECIVTHDAKKELQALQAWRINKGFEYPSAFVFPGDEGHSFYEALFSDIHKDRASKPLFFESVEQARKWIIDAQIVN
ncbi:hypothetical protein [uncultured Paraglaciecola sp.]|uniref:hypothetical protein n=1 Tax=uncultured Paraglaciecola sp. TaxID=1765024 RepID=UPI0025FE8FAF|nr:hypothetical protein [uncultured Paraglaciecola sp.]